MAHVASYKEPIIDRKHFLFELIERFDQWEPSPTLSLTAIQSVIDDIQRLHDIAEPLCHIDADSYTTDQTTLLGECHRLAYYIEDQMIQLSQ